MKSEFYTILSGILPEKHTRKHEYLEELALDI
jgi:hypothetical protein